MIDIKKRNNVSVLDNGNRTIMFGHGFGTDQTIWKAMLPYFKNDRVVLFDYVGSGNSDYQAYNPERYSDLHGYAQDLVEILDTCQLGPVHFVGHSVSGMIGLLASIEGPQYFASLEMICPSPRYLNDIPEYFGGFDLSDVQELLHMMEMNFVGWASLNVAELMGTPDRPELHRALEATFNKEDPVIMKNFATATFISDHRADLVKVTVPVLIIQALYDSIVPAQVSRYLHQHIKNSTLEVIDVRGHYPNISQPELTAGIINQYITRIDQRGK